MRYAVLVGAFLLLTGCSFTNTTTKIKNFTSCYIHKIPAPFWVCYQSDFMSVGKLYTKQVNRLIQERAYSIGLNDLVVKIQQKTKAFLQKIGIKDDKKIATVLQSVKKYTIINSLQGKSWYSSKNNILYVQVYLDETEFKNFLFSLLKNEKRQNLEVAFDEVF
jgi:hypothetical protein